MPTKKIYIAFIFILVFSSGFYLSYAQSLQNTNVNAYVHPDMDSDGMPNWWEIQYGFNPIDPSDADQDADGDLLTNLPEYQHGTNPHLMDTDGGGLSDHDEIHDRKNPLDPNDDSLPITWPRTITPPFDRRGDSDGDGISNVDEEEYGTDKNKVDTDDDGLNDYDEIYKYHTVATDSDSDKDGIFDGDEVNTFNTNPNLKDSDYDGLIDYEELFVHKTNPNKWDTDDGGMSDRDELYNESNPLVKDDDFQFTWILYYGNKPNNLFKILDTNKIIIYEGMSLTLEAIRTSQIKTITVKFNEKEYTSSDELVNVKLISPEKTGVLTLELLLELNSGKIVRLTRFIELKQKGQVIKKLDTKFENLYSQFDYFDNTPIADAEITIYEFNEISKSLELYNTDQFPMSNPMYSGQDGEYVIPLRPGNYLIKVNKPGIGEKEVLFNTDIYTLYSENIYINYNYDLIIWGSLFTLIFIFVWETINMIRYIRYLINKFIDLIARKRHLY